MRDQFAASLLSLLLHALTLSTLFWFGTQLQRPPVLLKLDLTILPAPERPPPPVEEPVPPVPAPPEPAPAPSAAPAALKQQAKPVKPKPQTREVTPKVPKKTVKPEPRPKPAVVKAPLPVQKAVQTKKPRPQPEQARNVGPAPQQRPAPRQTVRTVAQSADTTPDYSSLAGLSARPQTRSIRPSGAQGSTGSGRMSGQGQGNRATGRGSGTARTSGQGSGGVYSPGQIDGRLQVLKHTEPAYPASARRRNVEGWVRVRFVVNEQGRPEQIRILAADPPEVFNSSVQRAVSGWRFRPGTVQGRTVRVLVEQTIRFSLR